MEHLNFEEITLMSLYTDGTRPGTIQALKEMQSYLTADEAELLALTDSCIAKLERMGNDTFAALDLFPDFDEGDMDAD